MSYFVLAASDRSTLWNPAVRVGIVYVLTVQAEATAMQMDSGLRFDGPQTNPSPPAPGVSDEAVIEVGPFRQLVSALVGEWTRTRHPVRRSQLMAVVPPSLVLLERLGAPLEPTDGTTDLFARADEIAPTLA